MTIEKNNNTPSPEAGIPKRKLFNKLLPLLLLAVCVIIVSSYLLSLLVTGRSGEIKVRKTSSLESPELLNGPLNFMSLNIAHGRRTGFIQFKQKKSVVQQNLEIIAEVMKEHSVNIAAVQEADHNSFWSGRFDNIKFLAQKGEFKYFIEGQNIKGMGLSYGTGIMSQIPLANAYCRTFKPSPPTFSKGFVICSAIWPGTKVEFDIVSLHLDFSRDTIREKQVKAISSLVRERGRPVIIMGDFNSGWGKESPARCLAEELNLKTYKPHSPEIQTYPFTGKRLDWILISDDFRFIGFKVLPDILSDHRAVLAKIELIPEK